MKWSLCWIIYLSHFLFNNVPFIIVYRFTNMFLYFSPVYLDASHIPPLVHPVSEFKTVEVGFWWNKMLSDSSDKEPYYMFILLRVVQFHLPVFCHLWISNMFQVGLMESFDCFLIPVKSNQCFIPHNVSFKILLFYDSIFPFLKAHPVIFMSHLCNQNNL